MMNTAPSVRRLSIMAAGPGGVSPPPHHQHQPPPPSSAPAAAGSGGLLQNNITNTSSSSSSRRPTFLITPATASQHGRRPSVANSSGMGVGSGVPQMVHSHKTYENTYKVAPEKPFSAVAAKRVLREVMDEMLADQQYDMAACRQLTHTLADAIKKRVKELGHTRYKLVTHVAIGQTGTASLAYASRCLWNDNFDSFAEYTYKNSSLYAVGFVHAFYCD